jgi:hypothetical protein
MPRNPCGVSEVRLMPSIRGDDDAEGVARHRPELAAATPGRRGLASIVHDPTGAEQNVHQFKA